MGSFPSCCATRRLGTWCRSHCPSILGACPRHPSQTSSRRHSAWTSVWPSYFHCQWRERPFHLWNHLHLRFCAQVQSRADSTQNSCWSGLVSSEIAAEWLFLWWGTLSKEWGTFERPEATPSTFGLWTHSIPTAELSSLCSQPLARNCLAD